MLFSTNFFYYRLYFYYNANFYFLSNFLIFNTNCFFYAGEIYLDSLTLCIADVF